MAGLIRAVPAPGTAISLAFLSFLRLFHSSFSPLSHNGPEPRRLDITKALSKEFHEVLCH